MLTFDGRKVLLVSQVGSHAGNLNTPDSDGDWKVFVSPTFSDLYDNVEFTDSFVSPTLDYDCHDIRHLGELLWKANINFVVTLFGREMWYSSDMQWIILMADDLAHMNLPQFYLGAINMHKQKMSTLLKGTGNTQYLIDRFGYDTKQATHAMRCIMVLNRIANGMSVREALWFESGSSDRSLLLAIKNGRFTMGEFDMEVYNFRKAHDEKIKTWFANQIPRPELNQELNDRIKHVVKLNI